MDSERDAPPPARRGPGGRSTAAKPSAARKSGVGSGTGAKPSPTPPIEPEAAPKKPRTPAARTPKTPAAGAPAKAASTRSTTPRTTTPRPRRTTAAAAPPDAPVVEAPVETPPVVEPPVADVAPVVEEAPVVDEPVAETPLIVDEPVTDVVEAPPAPESPPTVEEAPSTELVPATPARPPAKRAPSKPKRRPKSDGPVALSVRNLTKRFGGVTAVDSVDLEVPAGTFFGFVGPNGAGKTTTLAMITGLLRPDAGVIRIYDADVWGNAAVAKKSLGVLPDNLRLFDRLTGREFLHHAGALRGLDRDTIAHRLDDLTNAFGLAHSLDRFVSDYSAGMVKKIGIAAAMIHSPRLLVLDEPFESVDPVSATTVIAILKRYAAAGGTVVLSSHSMSLIERICDSVGIIANGRMLASGPLDDVLQGQSLEERFVDLAGGVTAVEGMEWLLSYSD